MAPGFRKRPSSSNVPATPEELFRELRPTDRSIRDLLSRQADVLRDYSALDPELSDVALELPTGAGKTLVGLLLADFRRRSRNERSAYLCPNIQLAHQVARKGHGYGIPTVCLTGPQSKYDVEDWSAYVRGRAVAVTTYSAVFNTNPKIDNAQTLILDDAHAGEGYVADLWSVQANSDDALFGPIVTALADGVNRALAERLRDGDRGTVGEAVDVELVAPSVVLENADLLREALAAHASDRDDRNFCAARMIADHIGYCLVYVSGRELLIRPLIVPTAHHRPFSAASQRIYMSATLGAGGELERAFGVPEIHRLPVPAGAERQGLGRRFFVFPGSSRGPQATDEFIRQAINEAGRAVVIAPSNRQLETFTEKCLPEGIVQVGAREVEDGFDAFTDHASAVLLLANRYDGMDLPDDACRLVVLSGLPARSHLQERFLLDRLLAGPVIAERVRTRITQGAGRATRNAKDYAAVIVHGDRLVDFCSRDEEVTSMLPELQAEIEFGLENSESDLDSLELLRLFLLQGPDWHEQDEYIREQTAARQRTLAAGVENLQRSAASEVRAWQEVWRNDLARAVEYALGAAERLDGFSELRGYRALWLYVAATWAEEVAMTGDEVDSARAEAVRADAEGSARMLPWRPGFRVAQQRPADEEFDRRAASAAATLRKLGIRGVKFEQEMAEFQARLAADDAKPFEIALETLGRLLGFESVRRTETAAPDTSWRLENDIWFVFEAKTEESPENPISVGEVRQALTHPTWTAANLGWEEPPTVVNAIITYKRTVDAAAARLSKDVYAIDPEIIRGIGERVVAVLRDIRGRARGLGEDALAAEFSRTFSQSALATESLTQTLGRVLVKKLKNVGG